MFWHQVMAFRFFEGKQQNILKMLLGYACRGWATT